MLILSYALNLLILLPLLAGFAVQPARMDMVFGPATDARGILVCLYATIAIVSVYGLALVAGGQAERAVQIGITLFAMQILYKTLTLPVVGWDSPVVKTNLFVVAVHTATIVSLMGRTS